MSIPGADLRGTAQRRPDVFHLEADLTKLEEVRSGPLNVRFLLGTTTALLLICTAVHLFHNSQRQQITSKFLHRARELRADGDPKLAAGCFRRYLAVDRHDIDVREELGMLLAESPESIETPDVMRSRLQEARSSLEQVLRSDRNRLQARRRVVDVALKLGYDADANLHLKELSKLLPDDAGVQSQLGRNLEALQKYSEAAEAFERAISLDPRRFADYGRLAELWRFRLNRDADAVRLMDDLVSQQNHSVRSLIIRCRFNARSGVLELAAADAREAYQQSPAFRDVLITLTELVALHGVAALDQAGVDLRRFSRDLETLAEELPNDVEVVTALVSLALQSGREEAATRLLESGMRGHPADVSLRFKHTAILIAQRQLADADRGLALFQSLHPSEEYVIYLAGLIQMAEKKWLEASQSFEKIRRRLGRDRQLAVQVELRLAQCYRELRHLHREQTAWRRAVGLNKYSTEARLGFAGLLAKTGRFDEAVSVCQSVVGTPGVPLLIARILIEKNRQLRPEARQWEQVDEMLGRISEEDDMLIDVSLARAEMLVIDGQSEQAQLLLERALQRNPGEFRLWVGRCTSYLDSGERASAKAVIDQAEAAFGSRVELLLSRLRYWATAPETTAALQEVRTAEALRDQYAEAEQERILSGLAAAYAQLNANNDAVRVLRKLAERRRDDVSVLRQLLILASNRGDGERTEELIDRIRGIEGHDGIYWRLAQAGVNLARAKQGDEALIAEARRLVLEVQEWLPNSAEISAVLGRIELVSGNAQVAADHLLQAFENGERSLDVVYQLVHLLARLERHTDAEDVLRKLEERREMPLTGDFGKLAVSVWLHTGNYKNALNMADRAVRADPTNADKWLWLGRLQDAEGQTVKAEESIRNALQVDRSHGAARVALITILARSARMSEAETLVEEVEELAGAEPGGLTLAACYEALGDNDRAAQEYHAALVANPNRSDVLFRAAEFYLRDGNASQATDLLEILCDTENDTQPQILILARRVLSSLLVLRGQYPEFRRAMNLIEENLIINPDSSIDLLAKAKLLQSRPVRSARLEAIRLLESLDRRGKLSDRDRFDLARLHLATGDWNHCRTTLVSLIDVSKRRYTTQWLAFGVRTSLDHAEFSETDWLCGLWLRELERVEPRVFRTLELRALHLVAERRTDHALQLIDEQVAPTEAGEANADQVPLQLLSQVASLTASISERLERSGHPIEAQKARAQAQQYYMRLVERSPSRTSELIRFYQSQGRIDEALAWYPQAWEQADPLEVAIACVELLQEKQTTDGQNRVILRQIEKARVEHPAEGGLLHQNAKAALLAGQYDVAERLFREVINESPEEYLACNDLALLLAFRDGNADEALSFIEQAMETAGPRAFLLDTRASVYLAMNKPKQALQDLNVAVVEDPTPDKFFHLARAHLALAEISKARDAFERAAQGKLHIGRLSPLEAPEYEAVADAIFHRN